MAYVRELASLRRFREAIQIASDGLLRRLAVAYGFGCMIGLALILTHTVSLDWFVLLYWSTSLALCVPITVTAVAAYRRRRARMMLPIAPVGQPIIPGRIGWLRAEMLKTRVAHGYCSRQLAAEACPYANICEQCDNYVTTPEFIPQLQAQLADTRAPRRRNRTRLAHRSRRAFTRDRQHPGPPATTHH